MNPRDLRLNTALTPVLVAVLCGLVLAVGRSHFTRWDLTRDGAFSLEPVTVRILQQMSEPLTVRVYFTDGLEPPYHKVEGVVRDLLAEMRAHNPGRIRVEWVDPAAGSDRRDEARRLGVQPATLEVMADGRREAHEIWMGMVFLYRDRSVALPVVRDLRDLEFQITRRIREVVEDRRRPILGFLTGHGEPDVVAGEGALSSIRGRIAETYQPIAVDLSAEAPSVPEDVDVLVVLGPRTPLGELERVALDQYLISGRPMALYRSNLTPDPRTRTLHRSSDNLGDLLTHYGLRMETEILADRESNGLMPVPLRRGDGSEIGYVNHPLIPLVTDLDRQQLVTRGVDTLALPLASPLTVIDEPPGCNRCRVHALAFTGPSSTALPEVRGLDAGDYEQPLPGERPGPFLVVAGLEGRFHSFFAAAPPGGHALAADSPDGTRLLLVGSTDYALKNLGFFLNALDWLVMDADLLALRPDLSLPPALQPLERGQMNVVRLLNVLAVPAVVAGVCFSRARRRRRGA